MNETLAMENFWGAAIAFRNADFVWAIWRLAQAWAYTCTDYSADSTERLESILRCREIVFKALTASGQNAPEYHPQTGYGGQF